MDVELCSIPTPSQLNEGLAATLISLPEVFEPGGLVKVYPDVSDTPLAPSPKTVQSTQDPSAIGPFLTSAGIDKTSFSSACADLPTITEMKNGHVLELYYYFTKKLNKTQKECVRNLIAMSCHTEASVDKISSYVSSLVQKHKKGPRKGPVFDVFLNSEFRFDRSHKERRNSDILDEGKPMGKKKKTTEMRKKLPQLQVAEAHSSEFKGTAPHNTVTEESHHKEYEKGPVLEKLALIDAVNRIGGFWRTPAIIEREILQLEDKDDSAVKHAIYAQLQFVCEVLQVGGPEKGIFQHSKMSNGERTDFTKEELKAQLIEVVQELYQPTSQSLTSTSGTFSNKQSEESEEEFEEKCYIKKRQIMQKLQAGAVERALQSKQQHLESLLQNPSLLVGKTIKLACKHRNQTLPSWCKGTVIGIAKEDEDPMFTEFCVDFTQYKDQNRMEWIYIFRLIEDLHNKELIIEEY